MRSRSRLLPAALVVLVGAAGISLWLYRGKNTSTDATPTATQPPASAPDNAAARGPSGLVQKVGEAQRVGEAQQRANMAEVRVSRATPVATVNGVPITGARLLAWKAGAADEQVMSQSSFEFLKKRAIERELTMQAAKTRKLELTPQQLAQLKDVRAQATARGETDPAQLDFEEEEARAQILLNTMLEKDGAPPQFAGEADVEKYYQQHADEYGELPSDPAARAAAMQKINAQIRETLYTEFQTRYQQRLREYVDGMHKKAKITD